MHGTLGFNASSSEAVLIGMGLGASPGDNFLNTFY